MSQYHRWITLFALIFMQPSFGASCEKDIPDCASGDQKCQSSRVTQIAQNERCRKEGFKACAETFASIAKAKSTIAGLISQDSGACKSPGTDAILKQGFKSVKNHCPNSGKFEAQAPSELLAELRATVLTDGEENLPGDQFYDATPRDAANNAAKRVQSMIRAKCNTMLGKTSADPGANPGIENHVVPTSGSAAFKKTGSGPAQGSAPVAN